MISETVRLKDLNQSTSALDTFADNHNDISKSKPFYSIHVTASCGSNLVKPSPSHI